MKVQIWFGGVQILVITKVSDFIIFLSLLYHLLTSAKYKLFFNTMFPAQGS